MGREAGVELVCGRPTFALDSALVHQKHLRRTKPNEVNTNRKKGWQLTSIKGQVATMLKSHTSETHTIAATTMKRTRKKRTTKRRQKVTTSIITKEPKQKCHLGTASNEITAGGGGGAATSFAVDQPSPLVLPWFLRHLVVRFAVRNIENRIKTKIKQT